MGTPNRSAQICVGGMGEVCRARDTKLKRDVAIKVLPESVAGDAERISRLEREAKTLASLNHLSPDLKGGRIWLDVAWCVSASC